jgi:hypothetical protein
MTARRGRVTPLAAIRRTRIDWLWKDHLPRGAFSLLAGREAAGKSLISCQLAAQVSRGELSDMKGEPGHVLICATEDSFEHVIAPRCVAAGADLARVGRFDVFDPDGSQLSLTLPVDVAALEGSIREHRTSLVIIDPIMSAIHEKLDSHKDQSLRQALEPIAQLAQRTGANVLGIIHPNKSASTDPMNTIMGGRAFGAVARTVFYAIAHPHQPGQHVFEVRKNSFGPKPPAVLYTIEETTLTASDDTPITMPRIVWGGPSPINVQDVLRIQHGHRDQSAPQNDTTALFHWIRGQLADGPKESQEIKAAARQAGFSTAQIRTIQEQFVTVTRTGIVPSTTRWSLRGGTPQDGMVQSFPDQEDESAMSRAEVQQLHATLLQVLEQVQVLTKTVNQGR